MGKIQVVDDDGQILNLIADILKCAGYEVFTSGDGVDALNQFRIEGPDLLITDLNMPRMDGYELCRNVRALSCIPILIITGQVSGSADINRAFQMGADSIIRKPFHITELLAQVAALLAKNRTLENELPKSSLFGD